MTGKLAIVLLAVSILYVTYRYIAACYYYYAIEIFKDGNWVIIGIYDAKADAFERLDEIQGDYDNIRIVKFLKSKVKEKPHESIITSLSKQELLRDYFNS